MTFENKAFQIGVGIMSGTSLDGVDIAVVRFDAYPKFEFLHLAHIPYSGFWIKSLGEAPSLAADDFLKLENEYSCYLAAEITKVIKGLKFKVDFIACHGHTIFHQPEHHFTYQLCNGNIIAAETGITTVCDFRRGDVALGGQGAPLVPIGDALLFGNYAACLNLGGFANISFQSNDDRIAYDIGPANLPLNYYASRTGLAYDNKGMLARSGSMDRATLDKLNNLPFYQKSYPKSLGREWVEREILPLVSSLSDRDALATLTEHIANQIARALNSFSKRDKILATGGGCFNDFLIEGIRRSVKCEIQIPDRALIDYKEALIFALLGKLRLEGRANALRSVTGALRDNSSGAIYYPL